MKKINQFQICESPEHIPKSITYFSLYTHTLLCTNGIYNHKALNLSVRYSEKKENKFIIFSLIHWVFGYCKIQISLCFYQKTDQGRCPRIEWWWECQCCYSWCESSSTACYLQVYSRFRFLHSFSSGRIGNTLPTKHTHNQDTCEISIPIDIPS